MENVEDKEEILNQKINEQEIKLLQKLDAVYDIPKILNKDEWKSLTPFERYKMTYILKQKYGDSYIVCKIRQNIYGELKASPEEGEPDIIIEEFETFNEVIHESFIGLFGISKLTDRNYAKCFAKIISAQPEQICISAVEEFAEFTQPCSYVVYEYISGPTLFDLLTKEKSSKKTLKKIFLTLFQALHYAHREIGFTHYDLHLQNIIVHQTGGDIYPVLIDYGSSHIIHQDQNYGRELENGNIHNKPMWYHDIIKVLLFAFKQLSEEYQYNKIIIHQENFPMLTKLFGDNEKAVVAIAELEELDDIIKNLVIPTAYNKNMTTRRRYREKIKNEQQHIIEELYHKILPERNYDFERILVKLLDYFFPGFDLNYFLDYEGQYWYFQVPTEINFNPNFDKFINYADKILK